MLLSLVPGPGRRAGPGKESEDPDRQPPEESRLPGYSRVSSRSLRAPLLPHLVGRFLEARSPRPDGGGGWRSLRSRSAPAGEGRSAGRPGKGQAGGSGSRDKTVNQTHRGGGETKQKKQGVEGTTEGRKQERRREASAGVTNL